MKSKRIINLCAPLLALAVICGACAVCGGDAEMLAIEASAADAQYNMTSEYKSGKYYRNLTSLSLSGDGARDTVAIAMSQVGYHEGNSESDFDGESKTGTRDYVEYNVLYGKLDNDQGNGLSYGYYWCASFVNWCLRQAGIPESATAGAEVSCQRWFGDCKDAGIYRSKSGYLPVLGDIVFFKDRGSASDSTHVGLVRYSDGHYVYTVEGNTSTGSGYSSNGEYVALKKHALTSDYIVGYATPKYGDVKTNRSVDYSGEFLSAGDYISESAQGIYSDADLKTATGKSISPFSVFGVKAIGESSIKVSYNGTDGYISAEPKIIQITTAESIYVTNYVNDDGTLMYMPQYRRAGHPKNVYSNEPKRDKSGFVGWKVDDGSGDILDPGEPLPAKDKDITLKAVWDSNYYVVTFKNADGTIIKQMHGYYGTEYESPEPPSAPDGQVFYGWGEKIDGIIRGNATYTAQFIDEDELKASSAETGTEQSAGCGSSIGLGAVILPVLVGVAIISTKKNKDQ